MRVLHGPKMHKKRICAKNEYSKSKSDRVLKFCSSVLEDQCYNIFQNQPDPIKTVGATAILVQKSGIPAFSERFGGLPTYLRVYPPTQGDSTSKTVLPGMHAYATKTQENCFLGQNRPKKPVYLPTKIRIWLKFRTPLGLTVQLTKVSDFYEK